MADNALFSSHLNPIFQIRKHSQGLMSHPKAHLADGPGEIYCGLFIPEPVLRPRPPLHPAFSSPKFPSPVPSDPRPPRLHESSGILNKSSLITND